MLKSWFRKLLRELGGSIYSMRSYRYYGEELEMIEDPFEDEQLDLITGKERYGFAEYVQQLKTRMGVVSVFIRDHQELSGESRESDEFAYDFLLVFDLYPRVIRVWCEDFIDFFDFMKELDAVIPTRYLAPEGEQ
jgi:hypothetical protein